MTRTFYTLAALIAFPIAFGAGYLTNGYVQRDSLLASYNGANQMRCDALAETERANAKEQSLVRFLQRLGETEEGSDLPEPTPRPLDEAGWSL